MKFKDTGEQLFWTSLFVAWTQELFRIGLVGDPHAEAAKKADEGLAMYRERQR